MMKKNIIIIIFIEMTQLINGIVVRMLLEFSPGHVPTQRARDMLNGRHVGTLDFDGFHIKYATPVRTASD